ncbi:MAG TPA: M56 family peptidase, partial [Leeuwenhoekiella sp.]|nr:M56 family peptidase [Leeuwenhoekiella sp.]
LLKSSLLLGIFLLCYRFLLSKETFYAFNRYFLIVGLMSPLVLPGIIFTRTIHVAPLNVAQWQLAEIGNLEALPTEVPAYDFWQLALIVYGAGALLFLGYFIYQLTSLFLYLKKQDFYTENGLIYVEISGVTAPFSFLKYIIYDPQAHTSQELQMILQHEQAHARQLHSIDVLMSRVCCILLWFNPLSWLSARYIKQNLEFLADSSVTKRPFSSKSYQLALLKNATGAAVPQLAQSFYKSFIKKRIIMLNTTQSQNRNRYRVLVLLPFLAAFLWSFNVKEETRVLSNGKTENSSTSANPTLYFERNSTSDDIREIEDYFKNKVAELDLKISVEKRSIQGEILSFNVSAKYKEKRQSEFMGRFSVNNEKSSFLYQIRYLGDGEVQFINLEEPNNSFFITKNGNKAVFDKTKMGQHLKDKAFRFEIAPTTTEPEMEALAVKLKEEYNVELNYKYLFYDDSGAIIAVNLEMKDLRNKNVSKLNLKNSDGLGTIVLFRSEQGTLGFKSGGTSSATSTHSTMSTRTSSTTSGDSSNVNTNISMEAQEKALEAQQAAIEEQREALEHQRAVLDEQQVRLEQQQQEMNKAMQEQRETIKKRREIVSNKTEQLDKNVLYLLDGEEITKEEMDKIDPEEIESINVLKDAEMLKKFGDKAKGKDGVIDIKLKKENEE